MPTVAETSAYVVRLGHDTLAVDQFTRVGDRLEGALVTRYPQAVVTHYLVTLNPDGTVSLVESSRRLADGGLVPPGNVRSTTVTYTPDSAITRQQRDTLVTTRVAAAMAFPYINYSMAFMQLPIAALRASNRDSARYAILPVGGGTTTPMSVARRDLGRYTVTIGAYQHDVRTNGRGVVQSVDGTGTTQQFIAQRQSSADVSGIASAWSALARMPLSSRDTVRATIGSTRLWVDYGRPAARGRRVFGESGVLNDTLWRTGANAATQFRTSAPLTMAGHTVPAGTYTLWTLAIPGRSQLIINRQTGQWGTVYDPAQDLIRVPLARTELLSVVERFTIAIDAVGANGGVLRLRWDTTEWSVPFTAP
ncbi:MAG: DUF2911 domain-containing protein [Gemmatimonadaceae bacterium]